MAVHCASKNVPRLVGYNIDICEHILILFWQK